MTNTTDLIERLREHGAHQIGDAFKTCREAADELERLRRERDKLADDLAGEIREGSRLERELAEAQARLDRATHVLLPLARTAIDARLYAATCEAIDAFLTPSATP